MNTATLKLANRLTTQKRDYIGRTEVGKETSFNIEGREGCALQVLTSKFYSGAGTHFRLVKVEPSNVPGIGQCVSFTMCGGTSKSIRHSEVKRFTQKIADELHEKALVELQRMIDAGEFNLAGNI